MIEYFKVSNAKNTLCFDCVSSQSVSLPINHPKKRIRVLMSFRVWALHSESTKWGSFRKSNSFIICGMRAHAIHSFPHIFTIKFIQWMEVFSAYVFQATRCPKSLAIFLARSFLTIWNSYMANHLHASDFDSTYSIHWIPIKRFHFIRNYYD